MNARLWWAGGLQGLWGPAGLLKPPVPARHGSSVALAPLAPTRVRVNPTDTSLIDRGDNEITEIPLLQASYANVQ